MCIRDRPKHYLLIRAVTLKIQRTVRNWMLRSRINSLIDIAKYAAKINTTKLFLEQTTYHNLEKTIIKKDKLEKRSTLVEKGFRFGVNDQDFKVAIAYSNKVDKAGRYK